MIEPGLSLVSRLMARYADFFIKHPYVSQGIFGSVLLVSQDAFVQKFIEKKPKLDVERSLGYALFGCFSGVALRSWYGLLDSKINHPRLANPIVKSMVKVAGEQKFREIENQLTRISFPSGSNHPHAAVQSDGHGIGDAVSGNTIHQLLPRPIAQSSRVQHDHRRGMEHDDGRRQKSRRKFFISLFARLDSLFRLLRQRNARTGRHHRRSNQNRLQIENFSLVKSVYVSRALRATWINKNFAGSSPKCFAFTSI